MLAWMLRSSRAFLIAAAAAVLAASLAAGPTRAQSGPPADQQPPEPDLSKLHGRALVEEACGDCHGMDGVSEDPETPKLGGQKASYLRDQMLAYKSGARYADAMTDRMAPISDAQIDELAQFYSRLPVKPDPVDDPEAARAGARIFRLGRYRVPPCANCHGPHPAGSMMGGGGMMGGMGMMAIDPALVPNLNGQHAASTLDALKAYASGARRSDVMGPIAAGLSAADRKAVAQYLAGLR